MLLPWLMAQIETHVEELAEKGRRVAMLGSFRAQEPA